MILPASLNRLLAPLSKKSTSSNQPAKPDPYNVHAVWITPERRPVTGGGLGVVSKTIPAGLNQTAHMDTRVIIPGSKPIKKQAEQLEKAGKPYQQTSHQTGISFTLTDMYGKPQEINVKERFEPETNTWVYSIENEDWFGKYDNVYNVGNKPNEYKNRDEMIHAHFLFSEAAAKLSEYLGHQKRRSGIQALLHPRGFHPFSMNEHNGKLDVAIANDTQAASVLPLLDDSSTHRMYVLHNQYDTPVKMEDSSGHPNPVIPKKIAQAYKRYFPDATVFSPLAVGIKTAGSVVVNRNYAKDLVESTTGPLDGNYTESSESKSKAEGSTIKKSESVPQEESNNPVPWTLLRQKIRAGRAPDIHHEAPPNYNPYKVIKPRVANNPFSNGHDGKLQTFEIAPLKKSESASGPSLQDIKAWKQDALKKVHAYLGMPDNPKAVPFFFVGRLDPRQKGTFLILDNMEKVIKTNPNAEFFFAVPDLAEPKSKQLIEKLQSNPLTKDKVRFFVGMGNQPINEALAAASVGGLAPSGDEPMGLIQFEYGQMFAVPVVTRAQGLLSSTNDLDSTAYRKENGYTAFAPDVEKYGQTAYHLDLSTKDLKDYQQAVIYRMMSDKEKKAWNLTPEVKTQLKNALEKADTAYLNAINRVYKGYEESPDDVLTVGKNMATYTAQRHNQDYISNSLWRKRIIMPSLDRDRQQSAFGAGYPEQKTPLSIRVKQYLMGGHQA